MAATYTAVINHPEYPEGPNLWTSEPQATLADAYKHLARLALKTGRWSFDSIVECRDPDVIAGFPNVITDFLKKKKTLFKKKNYDNVNKMFYEEVVCEYITDHDSFMTLHNHLMYWMYDRNVFYILGGTVGRNAPYDEEVNMEKINIIIERDESY